MKNIALIILIFCSASFFSQNNFDYLRSWATYFGPVGTNLYTSLSTKTLIFDKTNNIRLTGYVKKANGYADSYYNQFISSGSQNFNAANSISVYNTKLYPNGNFLNRSYIGSINPINSELVLAYDNLGNYFVSKITQNGFTNLNGTLGSWLPSNPFVVDNSILESVTLSKYAANGNLLWTTFIPKDSYGFDINIDSQNNIFISGQTTLQNGIGSPGVYNENFTVGYGSNNNLLPNGFIVKLNPQGGKIWGTYLTTGLDFVNVYNDDIYFLGSSYFPNINVATSNTFQQTASDKAIVKVNGQNGTRTWGTYFGDPNQQSFDLTFGMKVNENGVFIQGLVYNYSNSGYFTTPGAFKENISGSSDLYITKFNLNGNRIWGTFFGGSGAEVSGFTNPMDILGNEIIFTGLQIGGENLSTENAFKTNRNGSGTDMFFTKFDTDGNRLWTSYYGGPDNAIDNATEEISVKIKDANTFYLYGNTSALTDISTANSAQPSILLPNGTSVGYIARFDLKEPLSTSESEINKDLVLYNNPNNGIFTIEGDLLQKRNCTLRIYDLSGKIIVQQNMSKERKQIFNFHSKLVNGSYIIQVYDKDSLLKNFKIIVK